MLCLILIFLPIPFPTTALMTTLPRTVFFKFADPQKYKNNGLGFSLNPKPHYEILNITTHNPKTNKSYTYKTLEELSDFCPIQFEVKQNKLHIAAQKVQRINIWKEGKSKPQLTYDSKVLRGYQVRDGECILELVHYPSAGTIRIHLNLSLENHSASKSVPSVESSSTIEPQGTTAVDSDSSIKGLDAHLEPSDKKSNRPTIKPPHQEEEEEEPASSVQQEPINTQTPAGTEQSSKNAGISSEQLEQIEAIVDGLLNRLDAVDQVVDTLIERQKTHNAKQTELEANIQKVVPEITSIIEK